MESRGRTNASRFPVGIDLMQHCSTLPIWRVLLAVAIAAISISMVGCPSCEQTFDDAEDGFVVLMDASPDGLDPRFATTDATMKLVSLLHEGLVSVDTPDGTLENRLASRIEQTSPTRYEIELRDDAVFHDGEPVTADDVEYTYMNLGDVGSPRRAMNDRIESFEIIDDHNFVIVLNEPHAPFEQDLSLGILPRHICEGHDNCPGDPVGAGAFRFEERPGELEIEFRAFDDHFDSSPAIERLIFRVIRDDNARLLALLGDTADVVQNAVSPVMMPVVEDEDRFDIQTDSSFGYTYLAFNLDHPILGDQKVRKAIAYAIDRDQIIEHKFRGLARPATGMLVPDHWAYEGDVETYDYDPDRARQLLDEAGYEADDGQWRFEVEFKVSANAFRRSLAQLMAQQLGEVGIGVRVRAYEWGTFYSDIQSRNFEITTMQWPGVQEPHIFHWIFHSDNIPSPDNQAAGANRGAYENERVDELLELGQRETDRQRRAEIYGEIQQILADELPYVSLWHPENVAVLRQGIEGYYTTPNARYDSLRSAIPAPEQQAQ